MVILRSWTRNTMSRAMGVELLQVAWKYAFPRFPLTPVDFRVIRPVAPPWVSIGVACLLACSFVRSLARLLFA